MGDIHYWVQKTFPKKPILALFSNLRAAARKFEDIDKIAVFKAILCLYLNLRAAARKIRYIYHIGIFIRIFGKDIQQFDQKTTLKRPLWLYSQIYDRGS